MKPRLTLLVICGLLNVTYAQDKPSTRAVVDLEADFAPKRALILYTHGDDQGIVSAMVIKNDRDSRKLTLAGVVPYACPLNILGVVEGESGTLSYSQKRVLACDKESMETLSVEDLKTRIIERQRILKSLQVQLSAQQDTLNRLQTDADLIANVSKMVAAEDNLSIINADIERIDKAIETARLDSAQISKQQAPRNYEVRKAALTAQLGQLTQISQGVEIEERKRHESAHDELAAKLSLIEETRYEQVDRLEADLKEIKKKRMALESRVVKSAPAGGGEASGQGDR